MEALMDSLLAEQLVSIHEMATGKIATLESLDDQEM
jgi:hypothetical protein